MSIQSHSPVDWTSRLPPALQSHSILTRSSHSHIDYSGTLLTGLLAPSVTLFPNCFTATPENFPTPKPHYHVLAHTLFLAPYDSGNSQAQILHRDPQGPLCRDHSRALQLHCLCFSSPPYSSNASLLPRCFSVPWPHPLMPHSHTHTALEV